jgi:hypothetical protein
MGYAEKFQIVLISKFETPLNICFFALFAHGSML